MNGVRWWSALVVLLASIAVEYGLPHRETAPQHPPLNALSTSIDRWTAQDIPIDTRLVAMSHVDQYLNRIYRQPAAEDVGLYVGYYRSQRAGDSVHSPKNCLPGAGWQSLYSSRITLPLQGTPAEVNLYLVEHERERFVVLYWYQSHGRTVASEYRAKLYTLHDAILLNRTDSTLVRITVPVKGDESHARQIATSFATLIAPKLNEVIPR